MSMVRVLKPCILAFSLGALIPQSAPGGSTALRVEVEPNALQRPIEQANASRDAREDEKAARPVPAPMTIEVWGAAPGSTVHVEVLRDCDGDGVADRKGTESCQSPLPVRWQDTATDAKGYLHTTLDFSEQSWELPDNIGLWLRVSRSPEDAEGTLAPFGLLRDACDLWQSLVATFLGGECNPGLLRALRRHKGPAGLEDKTFEVRRLVVDDTSSNEPISVANTHGATGVAWADDTTLLFTRVSAELDVPAVLSRQEQPAPVQPGLYRVDLANPESMAPELLWSSDGDGLMPAAPYALSDGRVAFVRQSFTGDPGRDEKAGALLSIWKDGGLESTEIPLPYRIHQILTASSNGRELLALSLGLGSNRPTLLRIDLDAESVDVVGYHHGLYHAAMRSPKGKVSANSFEDASGRWGWELELVDESGAWLRDLAHRKALHDLMPVWRENGRELAYLAEVSPVRRPEHRE